MNFKWMSIFLIISIVQSIPEQGKFPLKVQDRSLVRIFKTMFKDTIVRISGSSTCGSSAKSFTLTWVIRSSSCFEEYVRNIANVTENYLVHPEMAIGDSKGFYKKYTSDPLPCGDDFELDDHSKDTWLPFENMITPKDKNRKRRAAIAEDDQSHINQVSITPVEGPYIIIVYINSDNKDTDDDLKVNLEIETQSPRGYLSPHEFPLMDFYLLMTFVYAGYCAFWLFASWRNYQDLLRVQYWIMAVLILGMLEKAVFYSEYNTINSSGNSIPGAVKFAESVSALKRAVARMLVIVVSLGFGITRPRLGDQLHQVIGMGVLYFTLASIEAFVRVDNAKHDPDNMALILTEIPLAIIDAMVCWWIFMALMQTMKTLRLRRNLVKLNLYRHFSNTILFCVIASVVFILWSMKLHRLAGCMNQWELLWFDDAFWHILFSFIMLVVIILWRPSANNQRYAYSPLTDGAAESDEEEQILTKSGLTADATERSVGKVKKLHKQKAPTAEDDLEWIEENIPQTAADSVMPVVLDDGEDLEETKYQVNKME